MPWWTAFDVTGWAELQPEQRGLRAKKWVTGEDGWPWLRKSIRAWDKVPGGSRPYEPAIEAFTLELARCCDFDVAFGRPCSWIGDGGLLSRGFVSRKFHDTTEEQRTGAELMPGFDRDIPEARVAATLGAIRAVLEDQERRTGAALLHPFVRMLTFDAWIGNGDRHLGNWAVLVKSGACRFAPMFDTAGCLGAELQDGGRWLRDIARPESLLEYASACKSGFGDGVSEPGIRQVHVLETIRSWPEWPTSGAPLVPRFAAALENEVGSLLAEVPDQWWPAHRKDFAHRLLVARVRMLEGAAP